MKKILQILIKAYSVCLSPLTGQSCRFHPSCSAYTNEAVEKHGAVKGSWFGIKRLCKCHPYYKGKFHDPVP